MVIHELQTTPIVTKHARGLLLRMVTMASLGFCKMFGWGKPQGNKGPSRNILLKPKDAIPAGVMIS